jgi:hypothetical protein
LLVKVGLYHFPIIVADEKRINSNLELGKDFPHGIDAFAIYVLLGQDLKTGISLFLNK